MKKALITGILGQDGSYLTELLFECGYDVHGIVRLPLSLHAKKIQNHLDAKGFRPTLHSCRLSDPEEITTLIQHLQPDECYHLAVTHFPSQARENAGWLQDIGVYSDNVQSGLHILGAFANVCADAHVVVAGSCLMFSSVEQTPQNEMTTFASHSLYGLSKISVAELGKYFYTECGLRVSTAILYNHESPRRQGDFVTKKITRNFKKIIDGEIDGFGLHNLYSIKDWGYAKDYANGMRLMGKQDMPQDLILATGQAHTVEDFIAVAAKCAGITDWRSRIQVQCSSPPMNMPVALIGDSSLAMRDLGWQHSLDFEELVALMMDSEMAGSLD